MAPYEMNTKEPLKAGGSMHISMGTFIGRSFYFDFFVVHAHFNIYMMFLTEWWNATSAFMPPPSC